MGGWLVKEVMQGSLEGELSARYDVDFLVPDGNCAEIVCLVRVVPSHLEIFKAKGETLLLTCYGIEAAGSPILEADFSGLPILQMSKPFHNSSHKLLVPSLISQDHSLFLLANGLGRSYFPKVGIVSLCEGGELGSVSAKLKGRLVRIAVGTGRGCHWALGSEEPLETGGIGVGVLVGVLELVNVANTGEVLPVAGVVLFQFAHPFEHSSIRFIYFHQL